MFKDKLTLHRVIKGKLYDTLSIFKNSDFTDKFQAFVI